MKIGSCCAGHCFELHAPAGDDQLQDMKAAIQDIADKHRGQALSSMHYGKVPFCWGMLLREMSFSGCGCRPTGVRQVLEFLARCITTFTSLWP